MAKYNIGDQTFFGADANGEPWLYEKGSVVDLPDDFPPSITWTALDDTGEVALEAMRGYYVELKKWRDGGSKGERTPMPAMFHRAPPKKPEVRGPQPMANTFSEIQAQQKPRVRG